MKKITAILAGLCILGLVAPTATFAAKGKKKEKSGTVDVLGKYDTNTNGSIDGDEKDALRKAFESDAALKSLDLNGDGKLDDGELAAIKGAKKKKKK